MNYENMSDFEINQAVTCEVYGCHEWSVNLEGTFYHCGPDGSGMFIQKVAGYCSNPSDAWPIIFDNEISMCKPRKGDDVWNCFNRNCDFSVVENLTYHQNPLRAAMIVFLKVQEAKRG